MRVTLKTIKYVKIVVTNTEFIRNLETLANIYKTFTEHKRKNRIAGYVVCSNTLCII